jgi:hypothetical protein
MGGKASFFMFWLGFWLPLEMELEGELWRRGDTALHIMTLGSGNHDVVFLWLECVMLPVVWHALPGPTWGDSL